MARTLILSAILIFVSVPGLSAANILQGISKDLQSDISAIKQPIDETIAYVGSSQCQNVKKIFGIAYEQVEGEKEPDLDQLTLEYRTEAFRAIYNITNAAYSLPFSGEFRSKGKTVIFIHGFTDDPTKASFRNISESFLEKGGYNVLALDGSSLIKYLYLLSTTYVQFMGQKLGEVLAAMVKNGVSPDDILIVGHSLGSHIAGFTGKTFTELTGRKIGRISSLDPAGPCFSHVDPHLRLKHSDAKYVDVIHTDAGVYGLKEPLGHTDYYVNGGSMQPNCFFQTCSHSRAWLYYSESVINELAYPAKKCKDWETFKKNACGNTDISYMGYPSKPENQGVFYLRTAGESPYGLGDSGLRYDEEGSGVAKKVVNAGGSVANGVANFTNKLFG